MDGVERRLTTILAADVVGYSRLMGADEVGTHQALKTIEQDLISPQAARHHGRVIKLMGDGVLMEFASVVEAVQFAIRLQSALRERNARIPEDRRIVYRVGINLGDVIVDGDDVYGDGVNVAARLEALAEPGGICVGRNVRDEVRDKLEIRFEDLGAVQVKNIARPVRAFRVLGEGQVSAAAPQRRPTVASLAAAIALLILFAGGGTWWWQAQQPGRDAAAPAQTASRLPAGPPLPDKPSIAVLPFQNMSGDVEQDYFAEGMAEDITTDLSKLSGLFVIARNSSFQYRGEDVDVKTVGRELGVQYVLEGSVRRAGDQVRINAQLIDAQSGGHLWAERYDGSLADVFTLQDRITSKIVQALSVALSTDERSLAGQAETTVPEAYDTFLLGWRHYRARTVEDYRIALDRLNEAVALDPDYGRAWAALASLYNEAAERAWSGQLGIDSARLPELLDKALTRPTPLAYQVQYERLMGEGKWKEAETALERASALDPGDPDTYVMRSGLAAVRGDVDKAIALMKTAMRLDPHYPAFDLYIMGWHYLRAGDTARAIDFLERAQARNPEDWFPLVYLTAAYVRAGRQADAERTAKALIERRKQLGLLVTLVGTFSTWWTINGEFGKRLLDDLGKAGIPDKIKPEDLDLPPEWRLSEAELRNMASSPLRAKGRVPGAMWMRDSYPDGRSVFYWNGAKVGTSTYEIRGDTRYTMGADGKRSSCVHYRNPSGTKDNLDTNIAVCTNGIFSYATFPLPETAR